MKIHGRTVHNMTVAGVSTFGIVAARTDRGVAVAYWGRGWQSAVIHEASLDAPVSGKPTEDMLNAKAQASSW